MKLALKDTSRKSALKALLALVLSFALGFATLSPVSAANNLDGKVCQNVGSDWRDIASEVCSEVCDENGENCTGESREVGNVFQDIVRLIIAVLGIVAVLVIVLGGVTYASQGDPGKTKKAKDTILYGILGLALSLLAYGIVAFVQGSIFNNGG